MALLRQHADLLRSLRSSEHYRRFGRSGLDQTDCPEELAAALARYRIVLDELVSRGAAPDDALAETDPQAAPEETAAPLLRTPLETTVGPDGGVYVWVRQGAFLMGSEDGCPDERPVHHVRISRGFWLARCPVTNEQYRRYRLAAEHSYLDTGALPADHPASGISWAHAVLYCHCHGLRLPTEAEWEYAARGPEARRYPWGDEWEPRRCCNAQNLGPEGNTFPADSFPHSASWCGAVGMAGNVAEWCADWYSEHSYARAPAVDPTGPRRGLTHVYRGGAWSSDADEWRSAFRNGDEPGVLRGIGLRCVMPPDTAAI